MGAAASAVVPVSPELHGYTEGTHAHPEVLRSRRGETLRRQMILKGDHFASGRNLALPEQLARAPNFRQVDGLNVFGVAQPEAEGVADVCALILERGFKKVLWFNLREEPFVYINGLPYCVKHRKLPFGNVENTGVMTDQLIAAERQLKADILEEAERYGGKILLHGEKMPDDPNSGVAAWGSVYAYWEEVNESTVRCAHEIYCELADGGVPIEFARVPITDENPPEEKDFDVLVSLLARADPTTGIVFNCQLGRGRTTTGMTMACMMASWISPRPVRGTVGPALGSIEQASFAAVETLVASIGGGRECQRLVDAAANACAHMQNLRDAIISKRTRATAALTKATQLAGGASGCDVISRAFNKEQKEEEAGLLYLERYLYLIVFAEYLRNNAAGKPPFDVSFSQWLYAHPDRAQLYALLDTMDLSQTCCQ